MHPIGAIERPREFRRIREITAWWLKKLKAKRPKRVARNAIAGTETETETELKLKTQLVTATKLATGNWQLATSRFSYFTLTKHS